MSKKSKRGLPAAADDGSGTTPAPAPTPTTTYNQQRADAAMKLIDAVEAALTPLEVSHPATIDFVRSHRNVDPSGLSDFTSIVEQHPELVAVNKIDVLETRDGLQYRDAFQTVGQRLVALGQAVLFTADAKLASITANCQQMRAITEALARDPDAAHLIPAANGMKKILLKSHGSRRKKKPIPPPVTLAA
jgi:hypothetical protein